MTRVLGADPGITGAVALWDTTKGTLDVRDMPRVNFIRNKRARSELSEAGLSVIITELNPDTAWIERVHAMPKQGVSSSFNFGLSYGLLRGVLAAKDVPAVFVTPNEWKRFFRLGADKQQARLIAAQLFPAYADLFRRRCDDGRAEATLLARFGGQERFWAHTRAHEQTV